MAKAEGRRKKDARKDFILRVWVPLWSREAGEKLEMLVGAA